MGATTCEMAVLAADAYGRTGQDLRHLGDMREWRANQHLASKAGTALTKLAGEGRGLRGQAVHLPVACNELPPHAIPRRPTMHYGLPRAAPSMAAKPGLGILRVEPVSL